MLEKVRGGDYDLSLHFRQEDQLEIDPTNKLTSFVVLSHKKQLQLFLAQPSMNRVLCYHYQKDDGFKSKPKLNDSGHCGSVRGVIISQNDRMMITTSFDKVNIWNIDFKAHSSLDVTLKSSFEESSILSCLILPGNKYVLMGSREGELSLLDLA